jgi:hypothetical protein
MQLPDIVAAVADAYGLRIAHLTGRSRLRLQVEARQLAMWIARMHTAASLHDIGRALGRTHDAVRNGVATIDRDLAAATELALVRDLAVALAEGRTGEGERTALERFRAAAVDEAEIAAELERDEIRAARAARLAERAQEQAEARALRQADRALERAVSKALEV